jgi:hypothetical protein
VPSFSEARQPRNRTLKRGDGKGPVWSRRGGDCRHEKLRAGSPPAGFRVRAGPETLYVAPSGARRQVRGTERVISPAPNLGALRGIPAEVGVEETAGGLRPRRTSSHRAIDSLCGSAHVTIACLGLAAQQRLRQLQSSPQPERLPADCRLLSPPWPERSEQ